MTNSAKEILNFAAENDVKFIRLSFCDLCGIQHNISIMPRELPRAFEQGIAFDISAIDGFADIKKSDLFLVPDPVTLSILPWRPQQGRVIRFYCNIKNPDGTLFSCDTRAVLKSAMDECHAFGYACKIGSECEFYLYKTDENGEPTDKMLDNGGYLDMAPLDKGENVRREICLCLEEMGIYPESSHHEKGPGQNKICFMFSDGLASADDFLSFKSVVKAIAAQNGLYASFLPKPIPEKSGNGLHINLSLTKNGQNIFTSDEQNHSYDAESFIAGVLNKTAEMTAFLNPTANSYDRFGSFEAPKYVSWSHQNRSQLVRIPATDGDKTRMELRSPDACVNPYLAFALIIRAGLDGMKTKQKLPPAHDVNLYNPLETNGLGLESLPTSLAQAVKKAKKSEFVKQALGEDIFNRFITIKEEEANAFAETKDKPLFYKTHYFHVI